MEQFLSVCSNKKVASLFPYAHSSYDPILFEFVKKEDKKGSLWYSGWYNSKAELWLLNIRYGSSHARIGPSLHER